MSFLYIVYLNLTYGNVCCEQNIDNDWPGKQRGGREWPKFEYEKSQAELGENCELFYADFGQKMGRNHRLIRSEGFGGTKVAIISKRSILASWY